MSYVSRISRKIGDKTNPLLAKGRREKLARTDFSIFSNNCWAGSVYRRYGLPYSSPTAGLYFFASDYVKFASRLRYYTSAPLEFIDARESRYADQLREKGELGKPVARLDDIEVVFLHYPSPEEAAEKWIRRCKRINWDNVFIKFSQMNCCTEEKTSGPSMPSPSETSSASPLRQGPSSRAPCASQAITSGEGSSMIRTITLGTLTWRNGLMANPKGILLASFNLLILVFKSRGNGGDL